MGEWKGRKLKNRMRNSALREAERAINIICVCLCLSVSVAK